VQRTADGLVLVDSGAAASSMALLELIGRLDDARRVPTLFNTHWHLDQVGGNAAMRGLGAEIFAHRQTQLHLATPYYLPDEDRYQPAAPPEAQVTAAFLGSSPREHDTLPVRYDWLMEAHTDGDIYLDFIGTNVIAVGDAISPERDPELDWYGGGWLGGRIDSLELLLDISEAETRFVPSYGPAVDRAYVEAEHALMLALYGIMFERVRAGESAADIYRSGALDALPRRFDDPIKLLYDTHKSIWAHYNTISPDIV
jgi:glyoxylase-like metal-dependent hydrolase (beta-lactamase superfamily II)